MSTSPGPNHQIDVSIDETFHQCLPEDWLRSAVQAGLDFAVEQRDGVQVSVMVTGDDTLRDLNRQFRGLDEVTDVLSFSTAHAGHWEGESAGPEDMYLKPGDADEFPLILPPGELPPLGEVVLSYPQAQRQAAEHSRPVDTEVAHLVIHGLLHLVGHDHEEPGERAIMEAQEQAGLNAVSRMNVPQLDAPQLDAPQLETRRP